MESEQATSVDSIKDIIQSSMKVSGFDEHLKKAGGHISWNVVEITIKMKTIVRKPLMIKILIIHPQYNPPRFVLIFMNRLQLFKTVAYEVLWIYQLIEHMWHHWWRYIDLVLYGWAWVLVCVWLWIGHGLFAFPYIQKVNQGTVRRTGLDRVVEVNQRTVKKGGNLLQEVVGDLCRRDAEGPVRKSETGLEQASSQLERTRQSEDTRT